eukprot:m.1113983 g.1113983  ORF g.1113983 m.1113983 type:complete len:99 (+) comp24364_c0_seq1:501-797(+)
MVMTSQVSTMEKSDKCMPSCILDLNCSAIFFGDTLSMLLNCAPTAFTVRASHKQSDFSSSGDKDKYIMLELLCRASKLEAALCKSEQWCHWGAAVSIV